MLQLLVKLGFAASPAPLVAPDAPLGDSLVNIRLTAVGDLMCHSSQYKYALTADGSYDFKPAFEAVKPYLQSADFTVGNLETVLAGNTKDFSGYPAFNTPSQYADALLDAGFDALFTSNNHSYDRSEVGVLRTIDELAARKLPHIGTFRSPADRDSVRLFDVKGLRFALLGYTQFSNIPVPTAKQHLVNLMDTALILKDVAAARAKGATIVIANFHWGNEYKQPSEYQKMMAAFAARAGIDIVLGEHPHVIQPVARLAARRQHLDSVLVVYSMGNFFSSQQWRYSDAGVMLSIDIEYNTLRNKCRIVQISHVPTWVFKGLLEKKNAFRILPAEAAVYKDSAAYQAVIPPVMQHLQAAHFAKMRQAAEDTRRVLQNYGVPVSTDIWQPLPAKEVPLQTLPDSLMNEKLTASDSLPKK